MTEEPRVRFIEHQGVRILYQDLSNLPNPSDGLALVEQFKSIVVTQPLRSVLGLTYVANSRFDKQSADAFTALVKHNTPYMKAGAIVGPKGLQRVIYVTVSQLSGRRVNNFDSLAAAKDWLATQA